MEHDQHVEPIQPEGDKIPWYKQHWFEKTIPAYLPAVIALTALIVALVNGVFAVRTERLELQRERLQFDIAIFKQEKAGIEDSIKLLKNVRDSLIDFSIGVRSDLDSINKLMQGLKAENTQFSKANRKLAEQLKQSATSLGRKLDAVYERTDLSGTVTFDYTNNNGLYILGKEEYFFNAYWYRGSNTVIHIQNVQDGTALVLDKKEIAEVTDPSVYDFSSVTRSPQEGEIAILKNYAGNYAVIKIIEVKDRFRPPDMVDEVTFNYLILKKK